MLFALPAAFSWSKLALKLLPYLGAILIGIALYWAGYSKGDDAGANRVTVAWNAEKLAHQRQIAELQRRINVQEQTHRQETRRITDELADATAAHARRIATVDADFARRLSNSDARASRYRDMSESGATERANLASHAAQLDRSLEQGRRLVQEFRATVELRDTQLRALGQQILTDRALIGETDEPDDAPAG